MKLPDTATQEQYIAAMRDGVSVFRDMPDSLKTEEICLAVVWRDGRLLEYVPVSMLTKGICITAAQNNGDAVPFIPGKYQTYDFFMEVFTSQEYNKLDDDILDDPEMFLDREWYRGSSVLKYIPEMLKTDDVLGQQLCMAAVKSHGIELEFVPEKLRTKELSFEAVISNGGALALSFVPEHFKTKDFYLEAIKQNPPVILEIPTDQTTEEMWKIAVTSYGGYLGHTPPELKTKEICLLALNEDSCCDVLQYVPDIYKTPIFCLEAVNRKRGGKALQYIPDNLKTNENCLAAVRNSGDALKYVPDQLKTAEICLAAIIETGWYDRVEDYIPERYKSFKTEYRH